jgi:hypothetical protein
MTQAEFDYDTGLQSTATDENSQVTDTRIYGPSLRLNSVECSRRWLDVLRLLGRSGHRCLCNYYHQTDSSRNVSSIGSLTGVGMWCGPSAITFD